MKDHIIVAGYGFAGRELASCLKDMQVPFLIIDLVVASILMSMGMMMVPPAIVSLPFKLAFFVLADGWTGNGDEDLQIANVAKYGGRRGFLAPHEDRRSPQILRVHDIQIDLKAPDLRLYPQSERIFACDAENAKRERPSTTVSVNAGNGVPDRPSFMSRYHPSR